MMYNHPSSVLSQPSSMSNVIPTEAKPALDYLESAFTKPHYDVRASDTKYEYYWPMSGTRNTTCLRYTIPHCNQGQMVPDLNKLVLAPEIKITNRNKNGIPPVLNFDSGPCNNFMTSIFSSLRISFNTTTVLKLEHYPIYSYLRLKLNCDNTDLATWATNRLFYDEGPKENLDTVDTAGWTKRRSVFGGKVTAPDKIPNPSGSGEIPNPELGKFKYGTFPVFFIGTLDHFLPQPPFLANTDIHIELELSKPSYVFQSKTDTMTDINFDFEKCRLFVPKTKLSDKLFVQLESRLAKESMRQYFVATQLNTYSISGNNKTATFDCIANGYKPSRLYLALQETDRLNGKFSLNALKFPRKYGKGDNHFMLKNVRVTLQGEEVEGLQADQDGNSFKDEYFRLFHLTKQDTGRNACGMTFENWSENTCFLIYDFTATLNGTEPPLLPLVKDGHIRIELTFTQPTKLPLTLICMTELQSSLTIEPGGKVSVTTI